MYLFFDTETTGFLTGNDPSNPGQPHIVQLAAVLTNEKGITEQVMSLIVKPEGFEIPLASQGAHGISTERALKVGVPLELAMETIDHMATKAGVVVCHNYGYDGVVLKSARHRVNEKHTSHANNIGVENIHTLRNFCTMSSKTVIDFCAIPPTQRMKNAGRFNYKTPNLTELHVKCFGKGFDGAHNALADVKATINCFFHMKNLGVISL